jgi:hypothetical protein
METRAEQQTRSYPPHRARLARVRDSKLAEIGSTRLRLGKGAERVRRANLLPPQWVENALTWVNLLPRRRD